MNPDGELHDGTLLIHSPVSVANIGWMTAGADTTLETNWYAFGRWHGITLTAEEIMRSGSG